jgi:TPR repeat protein
MDINFENYDFSADSNDNEFRELLEKATGGDADAMYEIGRYYDNLYLNEEDADLDDGAIWELKALYWYKKAAALGHVYAHTCIGHLYNDGLAIDHDRDEALSWYGYAARLGCAEGQFEVGRFYNSGHGPICHEEAVYWYTKAAEQGHTLACAYLSAFYRKGMGVGQDMKKAVNWLLRAGYADNKSDFSAWKQWKEIIQEPNAAEKYGFTSDMDRINAVIEWGKKELEELLKEHEEFAKKLERQRAEFNEHD